MADPIPLEQQLKLFRQATRLKSEADDYLKEVEDKQAERWSRLRRLINEAGTQYIVMRIDAVEEGLRDKGAQGWLSVLIAAGLSFIPITSLTGSFLLAMTKSTQRVLTNANRELMQATGTILERELSSAKVMDAAGKWLRLAEDIRKTEATVAKFAKDWESELSNFLQNTRDSIAQNLGTQPFKPDIRKHEMAQTDAPLVVVTSSLHNWIDAQIKAENEARRIIRKRLRDLVAIATSPEPAKDAKVRELEAERKEAAREPRKDYRRPVKKLPKTNKDAMHLLEQERDNLLPTSEEVSTVPDAKDLMDLQMLVESMIWCATYDFTPNWEDTFPSGKMLRELVEAPLPDSIWKRLTERYIDPDEHKSYKDVGYIDRLGTMDFPKFSAKTVATLKEEHPSFGPGPNNPYGDKKAGFWSPKVRLSYYFGEILYPALDRENNKAIQTFNALRKR